MEAGGARRRRAAAMAVRRRLYGQEAIIPSGAQRRECAFPIDIAQPAADMRVHGAVIVFGMHRGDTARDGRHPVLSEAGADAHPIAEIEVGLDGWMIDIGEVARVFARAAKQTLCGRFRRPT